MGGGEDVDLLKRYRDMGVVRWVAMLPAGVTSTFAAASPCSTPVIAIPS